jgi:hypothetical protein
MPGTAAPETLRCLAAGAACVTPCGTGRRAACSKHGGQGSELQCGSVADRNGPGALPRGPEWGGAASTRADVPRCAARRGAGRTPAAGARLGARRGVIGPNWRTGRGAGVGGTRGGGGREGARDASGHGTSLLPVGRGIPAAYRAFSQPTEKWTRGLRGEESQLPPAPHSHLSPHLFVRGLSSRRRRAEVCGPGFRAPCRSSRPLLVALATRRGLCRSHRREPRHGRVLSGRFAELERGLCASPAHRRRRAGAGACTGAGSFSPECLRRRSRLRKERRRAMTRQGGRRGRAAPLTRTAQPVAKRRRHCRQTRARRRQTPQSARRVSR